MVKYSELNKAYRDAIRNKKRNPDYVDFELHRPRNLVRLKDKLNNRCLQASAKAYIVRRPVIREVFSSSMEMCVVHHFVERYLRPKMEQMLTPNVFNNRKQMGLDKALLKVYGDIWELSNGFNDKECWCIVCDVTGYFPNARQDVAYRMLMRLIDGLDVSDDRRSELEYMVRTSIFFDKRRITKECPDEDWLLLKQGKSIFEKPDVIGAMPGALIMQLAMTCYHHEVLSWLFWQGIKVTVYGDDFAFVVRDKDRFLREVLPEFRRRMADIGCTIHPYKFYCQHYTKGVRFCSQWIKMGRIYAGNRTVSNFERKVLYWNTRCSLRSLEHLIPSLNSYTGILKHRDEYANLRKIVARLSDRWREYVEFDDVRKIVRAREGFEHTSALIKRYNILTRAKVESACTGGSNINDSRRKGATYRRAAICYIECRKSIERKRRQGAGPVAAQGYGRGRNGTAQGGV